MLSGYHQLPGVQRCLCTSKLRSVGFQRRRLVIGGRRYQIGYLSRDYLFHLADPRQVGVNALGLFVEDPLTIQEYFHDALAARRDCYGCIGAVGSEELIRHPRGGSMVLSRHAVGNL